MFKNINIEDFENCEPKIAKTEEIEIKGSEQLEENFDKELKELTNKRAQAKSLFNLEYLIKTQKKYEHLKQNSDKAEVVKDSEICKEETPKILTLEEARNILEKELVNKYEASKKQELNIIEKNIKPVVSKI